MTKLNIGIVGCGFIAQRRHIPAFVNLKQDVTITALCDINTELASEVAKQYNIKNVYENVNEMMEQEDLDIVDICTPPQIHSHIAIKVLKGGSNVLMEKPMALVSKDCERMINVAKKENLKISVVHNEKFYPPFLKAIEMIEKGVIGKVTGVNVNSSTQSSEFMKDQSHWVHKLPGGILGETGPHLVYLSLTFLKKVIDVKIIARKNLSFPWGSFDEFRALLVGEEINSSILVSHSNEYTMNEVEIFGTRGLIKLDLQSMLLLHFHRKSLHPLSLGLSSLSQSMQIINGLFSNSVKTITGKTFLGHNIMIEKFVKSIRNNLPVPVSPEEGLETTRVMERLIKNLEGKNADNLLS